MTLRPRGGLAGVGAAIEFKSELLWKMRELLRDHGFVEVITPTFRHADDLTGRRATATLGGQGWLRSMIGPALRCQLQHLPRVYEIGACFRDEDPDTTHSREFSMLDLYAADTGYDDLIVLAEALISLAYSGPTRRISVADHLATMLGVDLVHNPMTAHHGTLARYLDRPTDSTLHQLLDDYIRIELEPLSDGAATFLVDMPLGGNEPCAQRREGSAAILNRFEVFIDGIEVVHGYQDETDTDEFARRAAAIGLYNDEQDIVCRAIRAGTIPGHSVGLGIGIERLCMAATATRDIAEFQHFGPF